MTSVSDERTATAAAYSDTWQAIAAASLALLRRIGRALRIAGGILFLYFLVGFLFRLRPELSPAVYIVLVTAMLGAAYAWLPRTDFRTFVLYACAFALFNGLRTIADDTGIPVSFAYPIDIDRAVFGTVPTVWLQDRFYTVGETSILDWGTVGIYLTYFWGHYVVALILWAVKRDLLVQHVGAIIATLFIGLLGYFLLPTSPPWFSSQLGDLPEVFRISKLVVGDVYQRGAYIAGSNYVAAMPSLHAALTAVIAITLWRMHPLLGVLGWVYAASMGFALIYLGEHYVVDVAAGGVTAIVAWKTVAALRTNHEHIGGKIASLLRWPEKAQDPLHGPISGATQASVRSPE